MVVLRIIHILSIIGLILYAASAQTNQVDADDISSGTSKSDISSIFLNHWHEGHGVEINYPSVHLQTHKSWWIEGLADNKKCGFMYGRGLIIEYAVAESGFQALQLYQTRIDCQTVIAKPIVIHVKFVHTLNKLIVPLSAFPNVNPSLVHSIVFHGPLTLRDVSKISDHHAYSEKSAIPTAEISIYDPIFLSSHSDVVFFEESNVNADEHLTDKTAVLDDEDIFDEYLARLDQCVDITNKMIRITYSSDLSALRKVTFEHKRFICENDDTRKHSSYFMFMSGKQKQILVPATAFPRSNPTLAYALMIHGPLTIHKVEIVHEPILNYAVESLSGNQSPLLYNNELNANTNQLMIKSGVNAPSRHKTGQAEFLISDGKAYHLTSEHAFRITYSAKHSITSLVTVLQRPWTNWMNKFSTWWSSKGPRSPALKSYVMFFAGTKVQILMPIAMFIKTGTLLDLSYVYGLAVEGNVQIHGIELIKKNLLKSTFDDSNMYYEVTTRSSILIDDFSSYSGNRLGLDFKTYHGNYFRNLQEIRLPNSLSYLSETFWSPSATFDIDGNAFRVIYSTGCTGPRLVRLTPIENLPLSLDIVFQAGNNRQIIIPMNIFDPDQKFFRIDIKGPLTIHKLHLVSVIPGDDHLPETRLIEVNRASLVKDAKSQILAMGSGLYGKLKVAFLEEIGIDHGGLGREFFSLISKQIFNPAYGLFRTYDKSNRVLHIDPDSNKKEGYLDDFRFVGRIIGFAITNKQVLGVNFGTPILKFILGRHTTIKDLISIDPEYYNHLTSLRNIDVSNLGLTLDGFTRDLIVVTNTNKECYITLLAEVRLWRSIQEQIKALHEGVESVIFNRQLSEMSISRLSRQIQGAGTIDVNDWKLHTDCPGYANDDPVIQWFWQCIEQFDDLKRSQVLKFVTGSRYVPFSGFSNLKDGKFTIEKLTFGNDNHYPISRTCTNTIYLPAYKSLDILRSRLEFAIEEQSSTFGKV